MPEAPEVANVIAFLKKDLSGARITDCAITHPKLCANMDPAQFEKELANETFRAFFRHGKYLVFELDRHFLVAHMRMEGKFLIFKDQKELDALDWKKDGKHIHAVFDLSDGRRLAYRDTRKFGRMYLYDKTEDWKSLPVFCKVGKDAMDPELSAKELMKKAARRKTPLKSFLLDQSVIAGIGNIYADEICFESRLSPKSVVSHLSLEDWERILEATRKILREAYEKGGSTIRTFSYGNHASGTYQDELQIHGRQEPCEQCGGEIVRTRIGGRSTWYCPSCQAEK